MLIEYSVILSHIVQRDYSRADEGFPADMSKLTACKSKGAKRSQSSGALTDRTDIEGNF
jgi:hypothetical protein